MKQRGLGKGLNALFNEESEKSGSVSEISLYEIHPNPNQPRRNFDNEAIEQLAESIRQHGVITPIALRRVEQGYEIIAGERRWRASRLAGLSTIPAVVLEIDERKAFQLAMIENLQREDLSPIEEARGYSTLIKDFDMTQEDVSQSVSKSRPAVANSLRLLDLPVKIMEMLEDGLISAGHGRSLLPLKDEDKILQAVNEIVKSSLNVRQTEELVKKMLGKEDEPQAKDVSTKIYAEQLEKTIQQAIGRKISITTGRKKGKISIEFYGNEDLDVLTQLILKLK